MIAPRSGPGHLGPVDRRPGVEKCARGHLREDLAGDADADDEWSRLLHPLDCCVVGVGDPVGLRVELGESGVAARRRRAPLDPLDAGTVLLVALTREPVRTDLGHLTLAAAFGQVLFDHGDRRVGGLLALCPHGDHEVIRTHVRVAVEVIAGAAP